MHYCIYFTVVGKALGVVAMVPLGVCVCVMGGNVAEQFSVCK